MDFDINSITSMYSKYLQDDALATPKSLNVNKDYSNATDDELMDVCKDFEAYFLEQCFKEMLKTVGDESDDASMASTNVLLDYYKDAFVKEIADQSTEKQGLGLAQTLYEQMKRNFDI
ncbi:MAG: rod-binding protein [Lachnospiraceae bacterium]|nr:rod-binding protein [Lachnospiraceae bacterium]